MLIKEQIRSRKKPILLCVFGFVLIFEFAICIWPTNANSGANNNNSRNSQLRIRPNPADYPLNSSKFPCGTLEDNAYRIEYCAKPIMDLIEGRVAVWPNTEAEIEKICDSYFDVERCVRDVSRRCMKGLHKTIVSTLATAFARVRKSECIESQMPQLLRLSKCSEKNQALVHRIMGNFSQYLHYIDKSEADLDLRARQICCIVRSLDKEFDRELTPICPHETKIVLRVYNLVLEEITGLICAGKEDTSKCARYFTNFRPVTRTDMYYKANKENRLISHLLSILFSLGDV